MPSFRSLFQRWAWLAIVASLGLVLAPVASHAAGGGAPGDPWSEICSANAKVDPHDGTAAAQFGHCTLCALSHAAPPPAGATADAPVGRDADMTVLPAERLVRTTWAAAQPRGPPVSC